MKIFALTTASVLLTLAGPASAQSTPDATSPTAPSTAGSNAAPAPNADSQTSDVTNQRSSSSTASTPSSSNSTSSSATPTSSPTNSASDANSGIFFRQDAPFLMQNGRARKIDETTIPAGQMLNSQGQTVPVPEGVSGFDEQPVSNSTAANPSGTPAATTSAGASTLDPAKTGVTFRDGHLFLIRDGKATRLDAAHLGGTFMMSLDGRNLPMPDNVQIENDQNNSSTR